MTRSVEVAGRRRQVAVRRDGSGWIVEVDGRRRYVDVAVSGQRWSLLVRPADDAAPASYEVALERLGDLQIAHVNGRAVQVAAPDVRFGRRNRDAAAAGGGGVAAPMPGRVARILVRAGDTVVPGQALAVVEAMKMENELRAPGHGTVVEVRAREGMSIEAHAVIVVLE